MRGLRVDGIYAFASPNPGDGMIGRALSAVPMIRSLRNGRDIVPDLPVDIAMFGEEYVQPRAFIEINEVPAPNDPLGFFAWHEAALYAAGAIKLQELGAAVTLAEAARAVVDLYITANSWDWINPVDGTYWALQIMPNGARLLIARGTETAHDWISDFDATQITTMGARMSVGFWSGVGPILGELDKAVSA